MLLSCMYFLSFTPLWVTVLFIDIKSLLEMDGDKYTEIISIIIIIIFTIVSLLVLLYEFIGTKNGHIDNYEIKEAYESKTITAEFLLSYILPLFAFDFCKWDQVVEFLIFYLILGYLCIRHSYFSINIILEIMQYKTYECIVNNSDDKETTKCIISRRTLTMENGEKIQVKILNNDISLDIMKLDRKRK